MLTVTELSMSIGARLLFENVSFVVNDRDRIGLVGRNGSGKSTLLRILAGLETPTSGSVAYQADVRRGYLAQGSIDLSGKTVGPEIRSGVPGLQEARERVERLAVAMADGDVDGLSGEYADALAKYESLGGYESDAAIDEALRSVGLDGLEFATPLDELSGGQQTRVAVARLLVARPDLLLLDEPTNHLDIESLQWLERFVREFAGGVLVVSHDREFLNNCVDTIIMLDDQAAGASIYHGDYDDSVAQREAEAQKALDAYRDQQAKVRRVEADIRKTRDQANKTERETQHDYWRGRAKKVARKAKARERRLERYIESGDRVEKPQGHWEMKVYFVDVPRGAQFAFRLSDVGFAYGDETVVTGCNLEVQHGERIAVMGPNGSGKTTLLRMMSGELRPTSGEMKPGSGTRIGYLRQDQLNLEVGATPLSIMQRAGGFDETQARTYLHYFLFSGDEAFTAVEDLSFGERVRLSLAALIVRGSNALLLDEPMNHLDIPSRERFEEALEQFPGPIVSVTHDRAFVRRFATQIWWLEPSKAGFTPRMYSSLDEIEVLAAQGHLAGR